jgi:hypothetical protein
MAYVNKGVPISWHPLACYHFNADLEIDRALPGTRIYLPLNHLRSDPLPVPLGTPIASSTVVPRV